jgi:hypothetical protein
MPAPRKLHLSTKDIDMICYFTEQLYKLNLSSINADIELVMYTDFDLVMGAT